MWIKNENNEYVLCSEYLLTEAIKPKETDYGTDFKNKEWKILDGFNITFFKSTDDSSFVFFYRDGFIGFGIIDNDPDEYKSMNDIFNTKPFRQTNDYQATYVFNFVYYLILESIKKFNPKQIYLNGFTPKLDSLYKYILKNEKFLNDLKSNGFEYKGLVTKENKEFHTFEKI